MEYIRRNDQTIMAADATIPPASRAQHTGMWLTAQEWGKSLGALAGDVGPQAHGKGTTRRGLQQFAPMPFPHSGTERLDGSRPDKIAHNGNGRDEDPRSPRE